MANQPIEIVKLTASLLRWLRVLIWLAVVNDAIELGTWIGCNVTLGRTVEHPTIVTLGR